MEESKKLELHDDQLDEVAGGRDGFQGNERHCIRSKIYACSNCGGHEFFIIDGVAFYYNGNCMNCGTYNSHIYYTREYSEFFYA